MFTEEFVKILQKNDITAYRIAKDTGISQGLMGEYKKGIKLPTIQNLVKIADYLNCSVDYLLGRTDVIEVNTKEKPLSIAEQFRELDTSQVAAYGENEFINDKEN